MQLSNILGEYGFRYTKMMYNNPDSFYFSYEKQDKDTKNIEIEIKINFKNRINHSIVLHKYLDTKYNKNTKKLITYCKFLCKNSGDPTLYSNMKYSFWTYIFKLANYKYAFYCK